jgi:cyclopropane fatty-acyl-phospholipid synthase-like methyltransferase
MTDQEELARWNARFAGAGYHFGTAPSAFLATQRHLLRPGMKALSIADGEGRNGVWLARQGCEVLSVDFSPVGLAKAKQLAERDGVAITTECADLERWNWGAARFDLVVAIFIQFMGPDFRAMVFRRIQEVLKPGGMLFLQGYRPEQLQYGTGGPSKIENLYTSALLRSAFAAMEILQLAEHDAMIAEGDGHQGMSALVDLVARKR